MSFNYLDKIYFIKYNLDMITNNDIILLISKGNKLPFAINNYPSRGQTAVQELYQTDVGKLFLKRVSEKNHIELCEVGTPGILKRNISSDVKKTLDKISESELLDIVSLRAKDESNALLKRKKLLKGVNSLKDLLDLFRSKR